MTSGCGHAVCLCGVSVSEHLRIMQRTEYQKKMANIYKTGKYQKTHRKPAFEKIKGLPNCFRCPSHSSLTLEGRTFDRFWYFPGPAAKKTVVFTWPCCVKDGPWGCEKRVLRASSPSRNKQWFCELYSKYCWWYRNPGVHHLGCIKLCKKNGFQLPIPQLVGFRRISGCQQ